MEQNYGVYNLLSQITYVHYCEQEIYKSSVVWELICHS